MVVWKTLPFSWGSISRWMVLWVGAGSVHSNVDCCEDLKPTRKTTSASRTIWLALSSPYCPPRTPMQRGWLSAMIPFPLTVVATGRVRRSASRRTGSKARECSRRWVWAQCGELGKPRIGLRGKGRAVPGFVEHIGRNVENYRAGSPGCGLYEGVTDG